MGQVESFELTTALVVDQDKAHRGKDQLALPLQFAHAFNLDVELDSFTMKDEMLVCHTVRIAVGRLRWIESHASFCFNKLYKLFAAH